MELTVVICHLQPLFVLFFRHDHYMLNAHAHIVVYCAEQLMCNEAVVSSTDVHPFLRKV